MNGKSTRSALSLLDPDSDHFFCCLTIHTTRATTTTSIKIGIHIPPYPPIRPLPHPPPFIMFPLCAKETPVANRKTVPTAIASKFLMIFLMEMKKLAGLSGGADNLKPFYGQANSSNVIQALDAPSADMSAIAA